MVIPARYASARLPGKALREIAGEPMVQWVYDERWQPGPRRSSSQPTMTSSSAPRMLSAGCGATARVHASGTDRIAEVARVRAWAPAEIVVNVQGDEPLMPAALIRQVAGILERHADADIGTVAAALDSVDELLNPNIVKVVTNAHGRALYFSRAPIPWNRDGAAAGLTSQRDFSGARAATSGSTPTEWGHCCSSRSCRWACSRYARSSSNCAHWSMAWPSRWTRQSSGPGPM